MGVRDKDARSLTEYLSMPWRQVPIAMALHCSETPEDRVPLCLLKLALQIPLWLPPQKVLQRRHLLDRGAGWNEAGDNFCRCAVLAAEMQDGKKGFE